MHGVTTAINPEGYLKGGLSRGDALALETWEAIERYHRFLATHGQLYMSSMPTATTAVVVPDRWSDEDPLRVRTLGALAADGLDFDVVLDRQLSDARLAPYTQPPRRRRGGRGRRGGCSPSFGRAAGRDGGRHAGIGTFHGRLRAGHGQSRGACKGDPDRAPRADLAVLSRSLAGLVTTPYWIVSASPLIHAVRRRASQLLVHFVNLGDDPVGPIALSGFGRVVPEVYSPDRTKPVERSDDDIRLAELDLYAVLGFETGDRAPADEGRKR